MSQPNNKMTDLIRRTFKQSGMSMKALSDRSGVRYASIHGLMTGTRDPVLSTIVKVSKVLGLKLVAFKEPKRKGR